MYPRHRTVLRTLASLSVSAIALSTFSGHAFAQGNAADSGEIVVTGTLIRQATVSSPLSVLDSKDILARGITNASELVSALPGNAGSEAQVDQLNQPLTAGTAQFNLRNLGLGSTLVLVNNRRQTLSAVASNDGSTFTDINSLVPLIALQRVEVIKDGAAATYGSDAVAGVVNFITRKKVDRPELSARYNFIDGARQLDVQGIAGFDIAGGDLVIAGSYYRSSRLSSADRSFSRASTFGRPAWHSVSSFGQPGSYFVPSLNRFVPDPNCTNAAFPNSYKNSPADTFCRFDFSEYYDLLPKESRGQVFASFNGTIGDSINLNLEAAYAHTDTKAASSPSFPILAITPIVPASHPDNPFGQDVRFRGRVLGYGSPPTIATFRYDTFRLAGGLDGQLNEAWHWSVNTAYSQQAVWNNKPDTLKTPLTNALRGLGGTGCNPLTGTPGVGNCQYFNPFASAALGTGTPNSQALIDSLFGGTDLHGKASLIAIDGVISGDLLSYSGGTVKAAVGTQYRRSTFRHDWGDLVNAGELITLGQAPDFSGHQETVSVFGEVQVPFGELAELNLAGRYEKYAGSFSRFTPKVSVLLHPVDMLTLRGSWGKAFRAPSVYQQVAVQAAQPSVNDNGTFVFVNTQAFGNPNLRPEKSTNYNLGATFQPIPHFALDVDFFSFNYKDLIVKENPQPIIDQARADTLAGLTGTPAQLRLQRDINGTLQSVRLNFINASSVKTQGLDVSGSYWFELGSSRFDMNASWTHISKYKIQLTPGSAPIDGKGLVNFNNLGRSMPEDRVEYRLGWTLGQHQLNLLGHYVGPYRNDRTGITQSRIRAQHTFDLQYNLTLEGFAGLNETVLTVGAINVADRKPPVAQLNLGFDPIVHDPRGRVIYLALKQKF